MESEIRPFTVLSYVSLVVGLAIVSSVDLPAEMPIETALSAVLVLSVGISTVLVVGWYWGAGFPWQRYRRKALVLWLYGLPPGLLVFAILSRHPELPWWAAIVLPVGLFIALTTLTFGNLPGYGGAWRDWFEFSRIKEALREQQEIPKRNSDAVFRFEGELCKECLTPLLPGTVRCAGCGDIVRGDVLLREQWVRHPVSRWERHRVRDGSRVRTRKWRPHYLHTDANGVIYGGFDVYSLYGDVWDDGEWAVRALLWMPDMRVIRVAEGKERSAWRAKAAVRTVLPRIDLHILMEKAMRTPPEDEIYLDLTGEPAVLRPPLPSPG